MKLVHIHLVHCDTHVDLVHSDIDLLAGIPDVAVGALLAVPLAKAVMDAIYPSFICNVACSMKLAFPWHLYVLIFAAVIHVYFVINRLLIGKINRISPAEILKNRE